MARRRKMDPERKAFINSLLEHYQPKDAQDIQDMLKDLLGETLQGMLEAEMDDHLGYEKSRRSDSDDYRNGYKTKRVNSSYGTMEIEVPQDRRSSFEPKVVQKRQKDIFDVTDKLLPQIEDWQNRPLDEIYPIVYIDAIHYSVRDKRVIRKLAAYVILGINTEGKKEVLSINVGDT